jgi:hypothetical protein
VKFADGVQTYNENHQIFVSVRIPAELVWRCDRNPPLVVDDRTRSGFSCTSDGWKTQVIVMTGCKNGSADSIHTSALRIFAPREDGKVQGAPVDAGADGVKPATTGKWIDLAVSCETVAAH